MSKFKVSHIDSTQLKILSDIKNKIGKKGKVLDVGCGDGSSSVIFDDEWEWLGLDINSTSPKVLKGDIHNLKFEDDEFDIVLCIAVLDRIHSPWIAIKEVSRVLKEGGFLFGTVAFLEPYLGKSYFHMTKKGLSKILEVGDLEILKILPNDNWTFLHSINLFPFPGKSFFNKLKSKILFGFRRVIINSRILLSRGTNKDRAIKYLEGDKNRFTGSQTFVARKRKITD